MSRAPVLVLALGVIAGLAACDRRKGPAGDMEAAQDWGDPSNPHATVAPSPTPGGDDPHAGVDMNDPHAGVDMGGGGDPAAMAPEDDREIDPNKYLRGQIVLTDSSKGKVPAEAVVFVFAKAAGGGPPLAVERMDLGSFPMAFDLDERDQMIQGTSFSGSVMLSVRVDQDSDVMTRQPGDLSGTLEATIPAQGLELKLDAVQPP